MQFLKTNESCQKKRKGEKKRAEVGGAYSSSNFSPRLANSLITFRSNPQNSRFFKRKKKKREIERSILVKLKRLEVNYCLVNANKKDDSLFSSHVSL